MDPGTLKTFGFALIAALGYALATIGMKVASGTWSLLALIFLLTGFAAATRFEIQLMRGMDLSIVYIIVIAVETLVVLTYATMIGEGLTTRGALGGALVLTGLAVISQ